MPHPSSDSRFGTKWPKYSTVYCRMHWLGDSFRRAVSRKRRRAAPPRRKSAVPYRISDKRFGTIWPKYHTVWHRMARHGETFRQAIKDNDRRVTRHSASISAVARANGLPPKTLHYRVGKGKWGRGIPIELAVTYPNGWSVPMMVQLMKPDADADWIRLVQNRLHAGWGLEEAVYTAKYKPSDETIRRRGCLETRNSRYGLQTFARESGCKLSYETVRLRVLSGESWDAAIKGEPYDRRQEGRKRGALTLRNRSDTVSGRARLAGLDPRLILGRVAKGAPIEEAIAQGHSRLRGNVAARARAGGFKPSTIWNRMKKYSCTCEQAIAMGPVHTLNVDPQSIHAKTKRSGVSYRAILHRMKRHSLTCEQAMAMGPVRTRALRGTGVPTISLKTGIPKSTIYGRMKRRSCTCEQAIAIGPAYT